MRLTDYHAKYFAFELTRRCASDSVEKLVSVLADAQVDLNPHQVEAALFAFRSPFSKGAILADEVGLGKTIEAGLLLAQKWAERKRRLLVIVPANLRKQWSQELVDKFYLRSIILETRSFNEAIRSGNLNPFQQDAIVLCSYQFARANEPYVRQISWDLVVIDEAHRLRNVYKNSSKIALAIKQAVAPFPKILLTATPLQNTLLELYGLVSVIDDYAFGDLKSYRTRFTRLSDDGDFAELKERLKPICKRTLRRQVLEYVKYTNRHALVQEFVPSEEEQRLYDLVSDYLQRPTLYALPASQRQLMTLILRKLLASSTYAISGTLEGLARKLDDAATAATAVDAPPEALATDLEQLDELADEWDEEDGEGASVPDRPRLLPEHLQELRQEAAQLKQFHALAKSIIKNSKGEVLLAALRRGFAAAADAQKSQGAPTLQQKAVIFTESRRTQEYLFHVLEQTEFRGKVMLFNGTNSDPISKSIYQGWLARHAGTDRITGSPTADMRAALVDDFRDDASILIATEAAAEGINLQFCNLVVNYDMPWNPQRIEQRIGRCHRYGQKFDVVVVNFLNKKNAADRRVYELLDQKFRLFSGVFGASDEVLGAIESGVDFEKRIASIYQKCRTPEQIQFEFDQLQHELEDEIAAGQHDAREKLLDNFDQEVVEKVRIESLNILDRFNEQLWQMTRHLLADYAHFDEHGYSFMLHRNPFSGENIHPGPYRMGKGVEDVNTYRVGHPLAQRVLELGRALTLPRAEVEFQYTGSGKKIAVLEPLIGRSGWLHCTRITISALETEDLILLSGLTDSGEALDEAQCRRLLDLAGTEGPPTELPEASAAALEDAQVRQRQAILEQMTSRNGRWFEDEIEKLDRWAEDRRATLKVELAELDDAIKEAKKGARLAPTLPEKLERQRAARTLETRREEAWRNYDQASQEIDRQKDALLDEVGRRLADWAKEERFRDIAWLKEPVEKLHDGYFAQDRKGVVKDTSGDTQADDDVYNLIMKDKERLLSLDEPLRFIFSHSALREGWDNPNVFQICTLSAARSTIKKRQEIGRGLRLPVNQDGRRVFDESVNKLYVMANESYEDFARGLQTEYEEDCGVIFGKVFLTTLAKLTRVVHEKEQPIGREAAEAIRTALVEQKMLDADGRIQPAFDPKRKDFALELPEAQQDMTPSVIDLLSSYQIERYIRRERDEGMNRLRKEVKLSPEFEALWNRIKPKTTYRVEFDTNVLVRRAVDAIRQMERIEKPRVRVIVGKLGVEKGGVTTAAVSADKEQVEYGNRLIPDLLAYLQNETELTRSTLVRILKNCGRLGEFFNNPQHFLDAVATILKHELHRLLVDGIKYERIHASESDSEWQMMLFKNEELINYLKALQVNKSVYEYVVYDSELEREFAKRLDEREDIKLFVKLPAWFQVDTPIGKYNPDWAILKHDGLALYLVRETKGTRDFLKLRTSEADKVRCGEKHFDAIGVPFDVAVSADEV